MTDRTVVIAVASYRSRAAAQSDFRAVQGGSDPSGPRRLALALLEKGADGRLTIDRHFCSAAGPAWDGAVLGGALVVIAAPVGIAFLVAVVRSAAVLGGVSAIAAHFWNDVSKHQLRRMSELIEAEQAALLVVSADHERDALEAQLAGADARTVASTHGDVGEKYLLGIEEAAALG
jgi:hypothetical protein